MHSSSFFVDSVSCIFGAGEVREISTNLIEYLNYVFPDEVGSMFGSLNVAEENEREEDDELLEETTEDGNDDKSSNNYTVEEEANHVRTNDNGYGYDNGAGICIGGGQENLPDNISNTQCVKKDEGTDLA